MRLVIVTGMSGAGKTSALKMLEDLGFYCVDNLPIPLMEAFVELVMQKPAAHEETNLCCIMELRSSLSMGNCRSR